MIIKRRNFETDDSCLSEPFHLRLSSNPRSVNSTLVTCRGTFIGYMFIPCFLLFFYLESLIKIKKYSRRWRGKHKFFFTMLVIEMKRIYRNKLRVRLITFKVLCVFKCLFTWYVRLSIILHMQIHLIQYSICYK